MLECVQRTKEHAAVLMPWRLDPKTVSMSFRQKRMNENEFWDYFQDYFVLKDLPSFFAVIDGRRVAFIGFAPYIHPDYPHRRSCEISIVVAPEERGKGIGKEFLILASGFAKQQGYEDIYAKIKPSNTSSIHIFEEAGFEYIHEITQIVVENGKEDRVPARLFCLHLVPNCERQKVFIIGEAGSNWRMGTYERDLKMAKALIEVAKESGCDAVKFQTYRPETVYVPNAGVSDYLEIEEDISAIFKDLSMPYEMIPELASMCKAVGIEFMSTPFSVEDFLHVDPYVKRHKIASYEISHVRLLECAAKSKKPVILSTGASNIADIEWALEYFKDCGGGDITLLQCSAQYPAEPSGMNLKAIASMMRQFQVPVGLSDHSLDPLAAPISAVALGATVIEKHFTLDRRLPGPDHSFALVPGELKAMCEAIRLAESMHGSGIKEVQEEEKELFLFARRRIQACSEIAAGQILQEGRNIAILRPGKQKGGCHPKFMDEIIGKKASRDIALGEGIQVGDWQE